MRAFTIQGATYYCSSFGAVSGDAERSLGEFSRARLKGVRSITEGSAIFEDFRACALRESERYLFLAASHYRRALDLMIPGSVHWAYVTLYYGTWFAAHGILGMLGCSVLNKRVIHVDRSNPGNQRFRIQKIGSGQGQYYVTENSSHKTFWELFYKTVPSVKFLLTDPTASVALLPVANNNNWLIDQRNRLNYNVENGLKLSSIFEKTFEESEFPRCLPGVLNTQFGICEGLVTAGFSLASRFGLATDALDVLDSPTPILQTIKKKIYDPKLPTLVNKTKYLEIFAIK